MTVAIGRKFHAVYLVDLILFVANPWFCPVRLGRTVRPPSFSPRFSNLLSVMLVGGLSYGAMSALVSMSRISSSIVREWLSESEDDVSPFESLLSRSIVFYLER